MNRKEMTSCYILLSGGLCNQLFEIAAAYAYCRRNRYTLQISPNTFGGRPTYWESYLHACKKYVSHLGYDPRYGWKEPHFHYAPIPVGKTVLYGYFQSSKYFQDYAAEIRDLFDPHPTIKRSVQEKYGNLLQKKENTVIIHVRRTDYVIPIHNGFHGILDMDYYRRAIVRMKELLPDPHFLIFSDDIAWCNQQKYFTDLGNRITFVDEPDDCKSLYLMSQFRHYIMANSTFSWWATWLGEPSEHVIVPDRWFGPRGHQDWEDIYEPHWIRLSLQESQ
jgi:hypothetical protein